MREDHHGGRVRDLERRIALSRHARPPLPQDGRVKDQGVTGGAPTSATARCELLEPIDPRHGPRFLESAARACIYCFETTTSIASSRRRKRKASPLTREASRRARRHDLLLHPKATAGVLVGTHSRSTEGGHFGYGCKSARRRVTKMTPSRSRPTASGFWHRGFS